MPDTPFKSMPAPAAVGLGTLVFRSPASAFPGITDEGQSDQGVSELTNSENFCDFSDGSHAIRLWSFSAVTLALMTTGSRAEAARVAAEISAKARRDRLSILAPIRLRWGQ